MAHFFKPKNNKRHSSRSGSNGQAGGVISKQHQKVEQLSIARLSDDGRGITAHNGKTVFVENALPNEIVDVVITNEKSSFYEAFAHTINNKSSHRYEPQCAHYKDCGGCHIQHIDLSVQQDFKLTSVLNKLLHIGKITPQNILPTIGSEGYHYRQRVRLSVVHTNDKILLGFRKKNSRALVDIDECAVMAKPLNDLIGLVREWLNKHRPSVSHVELINGEQCVGIIIRHVKPISNVIRKKLNDLLEKFHITCWFQATKGDALTTIDDRTCAPELTYTLEFLSDEKIRQIVYLYHPQDFVQANSKVNQKMINQAIALLQPQAHETFLDLFCGIGNFTLPISLSAKHVVGIEGSSKMVGQAAINAVNNHCDNTSFKKADLFEAGAVEKIVNREEDSDVVDGIDGIVLDPPRAGAKMVCQNIKKLSPNKILYISCDPNTFIRDACILIDNGYILKDFGVMDMFAQTYHSEVMGLFVLNKKSNVNLTTGKIK
jgi:23S rRNA (uracil1939-C5)-methyltransferase